MDLVKSMNLQKTAMRGLLTLRGQATQTRWRCICCILVLKRGSIGCKNVKDVMGEERNFLCAAFIKIIHFMVLSGE